MPNNKVISWRLAIVGVGQITAFYFQQIVIIRAQRRGQNRPETFFISTCFHLGLAWNSLLVILNFSCNYFHWLAWQRLVGGRRAHPKDGVVEVSLYLGRVYPGRERADLQLLPGVFSSAQLSVGGHQIVTLHALKYSMVRLQIYKFSRFRYYWRQSSDVIKTQHRGISCLSLRAFMA